MSTAQVATVEYKEFENVFKCIKKWEAKASITCSLLEKENQLSINVELPDFSVMNVITGNCFLLQSKTFEINEIGRLNETHVLEIKGKDEKSDRKFTIVVRVLYDVHDVEYCLFPISVVTFNWGV